MVATLNEAFGPKMPTQLRYEADPLHHQVQAVLNVFGWTVVAQDPPAFRNRPDEDD